VFRFAKVDNPMVGVLEGELVQCCHPWSQVGPLETPGGVQMPSGPEEQHPEGRPWLPGYQRHRGLSATLLGISLVRWSLWLAAAHGPCMVQLQHVGSLFSASRTVGISRTVASLEDSILDHLLDKHLRLVYNIVGCLPWLPINV